MEILITTEGVRRLLHNGESIDVTDEQSEDLLKLGSRSLVVQYFNQVMWCGLSTNARDIVCGWLVDNSWNIVDDAKSEDLGENG